MVGAVGGMLEVKLRCPVVGEVIGHLTSGASCSRANIALHRSVEGIATQDDVRKTTLCRFGGIRTTM